MQYELVVVVDPKSEEKKTQEKLTALLEKEGFSISGWESWGKKPLSYPIKHHTEGLYLYTLISSEKGKPNSLYTKFKLDESILRSLVLRKEEGKDKSKKRSTKS